MDRVAWVAGRHGRGGEVALARPRRPPRVLDRDAAVHLGLEDGRTLRWSGPLGYHSFFDLRQVRCPSRSHFVREVQTERVLITRRRYPGMILLRGCDLATGRDAVLGEQESSSGYEGGMDVIGVDRTWVLLRYYIATVRGDVDTPTEIATADVSTGDQNPPFALNGVAEPQAGSFAITDRGIPIWLAGDRLLALDRKGVTELDRGGTITNIHAVGNAVSWTHDGTPRSAEPAEYHHHSRAGSSDTPAPWRMQTR